MQKRTENNGRLDRRRLLCSAGALGALSMTGLPSSPFAQGVASGLPPSLGAMAAATKLAPQLLVGSCPLTPTQTAGPFYLPVNLMRQDITEGYAGLETIVVFGVRDAATCQPVPGAIVDLWHADYLGNYSSFQGTGATQMRGIQITNQSGLVFFRTKYPGWYPGRTPHLHVKVFMPGSAQELTTQVYFDDFLSSWIYTNISPYANRGGQANTDNPSDGFFDSVNLMTWVPDQANSRLFIGTVLNAS